MLVEVSAHELAKVKQVLDAAGVAHEAIGVVGEAGGRVVVKVNMNVCVCVCVRFFFFFFSD
jgi:hypothetical protein